MLLQHSSYILTLLILIAGCDQQPEQVVEEPITTKREQKDRQSSIDELNRRVEEKRATLDAIVDGYEPSVTGNITDLNVSAEEILNSLPGVVSVERLSSGKNPTKRIIHLRDWHFVTKDDYAKDIRDTADNPLSDAEIDALYEQLLLEVEMIQLEQRSILRLLTRHHGLDHICIEGLVGRDVSIYKAKVRVLGDFGEKMSDLRDSRDDLDGDEDSELIDQIDAVLKKYRQDTLQLGAAGQMVLSGELTNIRPSESLEAYEQANPLKEGTVVLDEEAIERRQDAIVSVLTANNVSLVILGGAHDLANNLPADVEYCRVTTAFYGEIWAESPVTKRD